MPDDGSFQNPFLSNSVATLADVMERLEQADLKLAPNRRRDLISSLRCAARLMGRSPSEVSIAPRSLRAALQKIHPAQANISKKRWANVKSDLRRALTVAGITGSDARADIPFSANWQHLSDACTVNHLRWDLSRFMRYCSGVGIEPEQVDDETVTLFRTAMEGAALWKDPDQIYRTTIKRWNQAAMSIPAWPQIVLTPPPSRRETWTIPLTAFPESFQNDVAAWKRRMTCSDPFDPSAPPRPLCQKTLDTRTFQIRMAASALVRRNVPIDRITSLVTLVSEENFTEILRFLYERHGGPTEAISGLAQGLIAIARHQVKVDAAILETLSAMAGRIRVKTRGLSQKNRQRLAAFDDPANVALYLRLPGHLARLAKSQSGRNAAVTMQLAAAIEILIMAPIRMANLASLRLGHDIKWSRPGNKGLLQITLDPHTVKNRMPVEHELPSESAKLVKTYIETYRPNLYTNVGDWLFPGKNGQCKISSGFSEQIKKTIHRHTGLTVNPHLMRHIGGKLFLDQNPGLYGTLARVLSHNTLETTMNAYTGTEAKAAGRHFDSVISSLRADLPAGRVRLRKKRNVRPRKKK